MKLVRILPLLLPVMLTACANNAVSSGSESADSSKPSKSMIEESSLPSSPESDISDAANDSSSTASESTELVGVCGDVLDEASFEERPDSELNELLYYRTDYGYMGSFDGKTYNSNTDPDKFDLDTMTCNEECEAASGGFFIVKKGDNIGGLTCTDAYAEYFLNKNNAYDFPGFALIGSGVSFEGEFEVSGYIDRFDGNEGYVEEGELYFYPDGDCWQGLPVIYGDTTYFTYILKDDSLAYVPFRLSLGTIYDYSAIDLERDIPQGSSVHMNLVLKDLQLNYANTNFGGFTISTATIVSAERIVD